MQQAIVGYHKDEVDHWVAELACGHCQHVRHNPPWVMRPWTQSPEGRKELLGHLLDCRKCEQDAPRDW